MAFNLRRVVLAGGEQAVTFEERSANFIVKNFSESDVYVSFTTPLDANSAIRLAPGYGQICSYNQMPGENAHSFDTLYLLGEGEVEVQAV